MTTSVECEIFMNSEQNGLAYISHNEGERTVGLPGNLCDAHDKCVWLFTGICPLGSLCK